MAFLPKYQEDQDAPEGQTTNAPAGEAPPSSGGSAGEGPGGAGGTPNTGSSTKFGSPASKLGDYLSANAPQIAQQGAKVAGGLNTQFANLNQGIEQAGQQFNQQVQGGYTAPNQTLVNQALSNPSQFTATPDNIQAFKDQYNNQYKGPQNFEGTDIYGNIQGQVNAAQQQANLLKNPAGLQSYLTGQSKNPTAASSTLDALLIQGDPTARQKVQDAAAQFQGLTPKFQDTVSGANSSVQAAQKAAQDSAKYAQDQSAQTAANFNQGLTDKVTSTNQQRDAYNTAVSKIQNQINPLKPILDAYLQGQPGLAADPFAAYRDLNLIGQPGTLENISSNEDYSRANALEQLLGDVTPLSAQNSNQGSSYSIPNMPGAITDNNKTISTNIAKDATQRLFEALGSPHDASAGHYGNPMADMSDAIMFQRLKKNGDPRWKAYSDLLQGLSSFTPEGFIKQTQQSGSIPGGFSLDQFYKG